MTTTDPQSAIDAEKLSNKELAEFLRLLEEQEKAYSDNKLSIYTPHENGVDGGQLAFHKSNAKIRMVITGNRWGKTTASIIETAWLALGIHPYRKLPIPNRGKLYADSYPVVMDNIYLKLQEWIPLKFLDRKKPYTYNNQGLLTGVNWHNGSITKIGSYDQIERKAEGSNWHYIGFDEPPSRDLYIANLRGLIDFGGIMWFTMTPLSEAWIFDDLWEPGIKKRKKFIDCFRGTSDDNPHTDKASLDVFVSELTAQEKEIRYYGKFSKLSGLVIDTYESDISLIDPFEINDEFVIYEGLDPHSRKPNAALWKAIDAEGYRFVIDELSCPRGMEDFAKEVAQKRRELTANGAKLVHSITDTSMNQDDMKTKSNQFNEFKAALRAEGESVMPVLAQKKDWLMPGIAKIKDLYRPVIQQSDDGELIFGDKPMPKEYIFKNCVLYESELRHYQWPNNLLDQTKPIAKHNEYIDCNRYIESLAPKYHTPGSVFVRHNNPNAYRKIVRPTKRETRMFSRR